MSLPFRMLGVLTVVASLFQSPNSFADRIEDRLHGVGVDVDIHTRTVLGTPAGGFDQTDVRCNPPNPDAGPGKPGVPQGHGHGVASCQIHQPSASAGMIGSGSGFGSSGAHSAHAFAELGANEDSGYSHAITGVGSIETRVRFIDRWTFEVEEGDSEGFRIAYIFTPHAYIETLDPGRGNYAGASLEIKAQVFNCSATLESCTDVNEPFGVPILAEEYQATVLHDYFHQPAEVKIKETVRPEGDPFVNAVSPLTSFRSIPIYQDQTGELGTTLLTGAFAINDAFDLVPNGDGFVHLSELNFSLTATANIELTGHRDVGWNYAKATRAKIDASNSLALAAILVETPGGELVTPEALGISVTSASGAPSPNIIPYEWANDRGGFWTSGSWSRSGVPMFAHDQVVFGSKISQPSTVAVDEDAVAPYIVFDSPHKYVLGGTAALNLIGRETGPGQIDVLQGSHELQGMVVTSADLTVDVASNAELAFNGPLRLNGSSLVKTGDGALAINNRIITDGGSVVLMSGTLSGNSSISGDLENLAAVVSPGASPGRLELGGNYFQAESGKLLIELSVGSHDVFDVAGELSLGGQLQVELLDAFVPTAGAEFDILEFGQLAGQFDEIKLASLPPGLAWDASQLYLDGTLYVITVPEPSSAIIAWLALALLAVRQSRKRLSSLKTRWCLEPGYGRSWTTRRINMNRPVTTLTATLIFLTVLVMDGRANLILNGSFEIESAGLPNDWDYAGNLRVIDSQGESDGTHALAFSFGNQPSNGFISQTFDTVAGTDYRIGFDFGKYSVSQPLQVARLNIEVFDGVGFDGPTLLASAVEDSTPGPNELDSTDLPDVFSPFEFVFSAATTGPTTLRFSDKSDPQAAGGGFDAMLDNVSVTATDGLPNSTSAWAGSAGGFWDVASNWRFEIIPEGNNFNAVFGNAVQAPSTVIVDSPVVVKSLTFDSSVEYAIVGTAPVVLESNSSLSRIDVLQGAHQLQAVLQLNNDATFAVAEGSEFTIQNSLELNGNYLQIDSGRVSIEHAAIAETSGTVENNGFLGGGGTTTGDLINNANGTLVVEILGVEEVIGLHATGTAMLDGLVDVVGGYEPMPGESFTVFTAGAIAANPTLELTALADEIYDLTFTPTSVVLTASAILAGDFNQNGILDVGDVNLISAEVAAGSLDPTFDLTGEQLVNREDVDVLLNWTHRLNGDADFDGEVQFSDFLILSRNFGQQNVKWSDGDFDSNSLVEFADFLILSGNFGKSSDGVKAVPEPSTAFAWIFFGFGLRELRRIRRVVAECKGTN